MTILTTSMTAMSRARRVAGSSLAITAAVTALACGTKQQTAQKPAVPVAIATVRRAAVPFDVTANGTVAPMQTASVSSQVDGILKHVSFREGQEVEQGQVLFQVDPRPYAAAYNQARANLERDRASAAYAATEVTRYDSLVAKDYVTKEQADQQRTTAASARATLAADSAVVANAKFNFDNTTIRAPIAGRTGALLVREGNLVRGAAGTSLVVINQIRPILVQFAVPATTLPDIQKYSGAGPLPVTAYQAAPQSSNPPDSMTGDQPPGTAVAPPAQRAAPTQSNRRNGPGGRSAGGPPVLGGVSGGHPGGAPGAPQSSSQSGAQGTGQGAAQGAAGAGQATDQTDANGVSGNGLSGGPPGGSVTGATNLTVVPTGPPIGGTLSFINNAIDTATGTVLLKASFPNARGELWPGEYVATVLRLYVQQGALVVPTQAIMTGQQGTYVFVIDPQANTATQRPVVIGRTADTLAVINSGLAEGERVVTDGQSRLQNGAKVNVRAVTAGAQPTSSGNKRAPSPGRANG
jgi:multidrug efflux pump subunit AcrA (membrane-fusion protein)